MMVGGITGSTAISQELEKIKQMIAESPQLSSAVKQAETQGENVSTDFSSLLQKAVGTYSADTGTNLTEALSTDPSVSSLLSNLTGVSDTSYEKALKTSGELLNDGSSAQTGNGSNLMMSLYQNFIGSAEGKRDISQLVDGALSGMVFGNSDDMSSQNSNMNMLMTALSGADQTDTSAKE